MLFPKNIKDLHFKLLRSESLQTILYFAIRAPAGLFVSMKLASHLGSAQQGSLASLSSLFSVLSVILWIVPNENLVPLLMSRDSTIERNELVSVALLMRAGLSLVAISAGLLISKFSYPDPYFNFAAIFLLALLFVEPGGTFYCAARARGDARSFSLASFCVQIVYYATVLVGISKNVGFLFFLWAFSIQSGVVFVCYLLIYRSRGWGLGFKCVTLGSFSALARRGIWCISFLAFFTILQRIDRLTLPFFLSAHERGRYSVGATFTDTIIQISQIFWGIKGADLFTEKNNNIKIKFVTIFQITSLLAVPILLFIYAFLSGFLLTKEYSGFWQIAIILAIFATVIMLEMPYIQICIFQSSYKAIIARYCFSSLVFLIAASIFAPLTDGVTLAGLLAAAALLGVPILLTERLVREALNAQLNYVLRRPG